MMKVKTFYSILFKLVKKYRIRNNDKETKK